MTPTELGILAGLALVDSTSIGTLVIPLWLLARPQIHAASLLAYLGTLSTFYGLVGLAILIGGEQIGTAMSEITLPRTVHWVQLVLGAGLVLWGLWLDEQSSAQGLSPRLQRWQDKTRAAAASPRLLGGLALVAGMFELATMLPYLAALSRIGSAQLPIGLEAVILLGYVLVMCLPALLLLGIRLVVGQKIESALQSIERWVTGQSKAILSTVLMIVGAVLAIPAAQTLGLFK